MKIRTYWQNLKILTDPVEPWLVDLQKLAPTERKQRILRYCQRGIILILNNKVSEGNKLLKTVREIILNFEKVNIQDEKKLKKPERENAEEKAEKPNPLVTAGEYVILYFIEWCINRQHIENYLKKAVSRYEDSIYWEIIKGGNKDIAGLLIKYRIGNLSFKENTLVKLDKKIEDIYEILNFIDILLEYAKVKTLLFHVDSTSRVLKCVEKLLEGAKQVPMPRNLRKQLTADAGFSYMAGGGNDFRTLLDRMKECALLKLVNNPKIFDCYERENLKSRILIELKNFYRMNINPDNKIFSRYTIFDEILWVLLKLHLYKEFDIIESRSEPPLFLMQTLS
ncbi:MAG: hypothetical protein ACLFQV_02320 [Vulcanimicrobiota bacterium]